jgi:hypothetical protein
MAQYLGVRYLYEGIHSTDNAEAVSIDKLTAGALRTMSGLWLIQLAEAAALIDDRLIAQLFSQIPEEHRYLAQAMQKEVDEFDFGRLMNLAQEAVNL